MRVHHKYAYDQNAYGFALRGLSVEKGVAGFTPACGESGKSGACFVCGF